jgi:N-acetylneuraminate synthase
MGCLIVGEVAQSHDGSLGMAHAFIDAVAAAGADAIKFQTHIAAAESTPGEPWRVKFSYQDSSRYDYWKRMEFTPEQWQGLQHHAAERGIRFLSSPFSVEAARLLTRIGVHAWKVASGEVSNTPLFECMAATGLPIWLSTGMSDLAETDRAVERIKGAGAACTVLQCTSLYPTPPERLGLNVIPLFRQRYACDVGLSDHSGTIYAGLAAATLGVEVLEVHVTLSREMFGPDVPVSLTTAELRQLVAGVRFIETARASPVDKDALSRELRPMRQLFTKSLVVTEALPAGTLLQACHLTVKKPGTGLPAERFHQIVGRTLARDVRENEILTEAHLA